SVNSCCPLEIGSSSFWTLEIVTQIYISFPRGILNSTGRTMHPSHREARIESDGRCRPKRILIDCVRAGDSDANRAIPVVRNRPEGITGHAALSYLIAMIG